RHRALRFRSGRARGGEQRVGSSRGRRRRGRRLRPTGGDRDGRGPARGGAARGCGSLLLAVAVELEGGAVANVLDDDAGGDGEGDDGGDAVGEGGFEAGGVVLRDDA